MQALIQLELDQKIVERIEANRQTIPEVYFIAQRRAVQGDRTEVNRILNNLRAWDIPQDEIDAIYAEAKKISADKDAWIQTPEGRWIRREKQGIDGKLEPAKEKENPWGRVTLRSPIDGIIIESNIHNGEVVVDNTVNLFQIADVSRLLVKAKCPEAELPALEALKGDERRWTVRTVGAARATEISGPIVEISYRTDRNQHTAFIKGYIENPENRIRAGQYVTVTVNIPPPEGVVEIPADALMEDGKQSLVLVQPNPAEHQFTMRRVQVTRWNGGKVLVRSTPIPKEEQLTTAEAQQGLLPKEPLRVGERVLVRRAPESVEKRLGALERKLDQVLEALGALRRPPATK